jgi:predicted amidohydrolase YtcJ
MPAETTVYVADTIRTMNDSQPEATAVAIRDGKILGVGTQEEVQGWDPDTITKKFSNKTILPGFIEAHAHSFLGHLWEKPYVGYFDRTRPDGTVAPGSKSIDELVSRLQQIESEMKIPEQPLLAWGIESVYFDEPVTAEVLDRVSTTRPIFIAHLNFHVATVNTATLENENITSETNVEGVEKGLDGEPTGILRESNALTLPADYAREVFAGADMQDMMLNFAKAARTGGCTTVADLAGLYPHAPELVNAWQNVVANPDYPTRVVLIGAEGQGMSHKESANKLVELSQKSTDKLQVGDIKVFLDGSIQGYTAKLSWPHYYDGESNGIWDLPPKTDELAEVLLPYHKAGLRIHCHCNGDKAVEAFLDAIEEVQRQAPQPKPQHTIEHCQVASSDQYRRMKDLGISANIFSNHIYYYGDQHYEKTLGPTRAKQMNASGTAEKTGIRYSLHSDAPVTPLNQLRTAWCAVNRKTASGRTLGENEQISVEEALKAVTVGAAQILEMDDEIGSIEPGKRADFTVLEHDPHSVDPKNLKDIPIWGTIVGGNEFPNSG